MESPVSLPHPHGLEACPGSCTTTRAAMVKQKQDGLIIPVHDLPIFGVKIDQVFVGDDLDPESGATAEPRGRVISGIEETAAGLSASGVLQTVPPVWPSMTRAVEPK